MGRVALKPCPPAALPRAGGSQVMGQVVAREAGEIFGSLPLPQRGRGRERVRAYLSSLKFSLTLVMAARTLSTLSRDMRKSLPIATTSVS